MLLASGCSLGDSKPATDVSDVSATLNADVGSNQAGEVTYWFRYGETTTYDTVTPDRTVTFPQGHNANGPKIPVSQSISGLEPETTYHFQICTSPGAQAGSRGCAPQNRTFTTAAALDISAEPGLYPAFDPQSSDYVTRCGSDR